MRSKPEETSKGGELSEEWDQLRYRRELDPADWDYGRYVVRRPESRTSIIAMRNVVHTEQEMVSLRRALASRVLARKDMGPDERSEERGALVLVDAEMTARQQAGEDYPQPNVES